MMKFLNTLLITKMIILSDHYVFLYIKWFDTIKYFENGGKNVSFKAEDDNVLTKYNEIWNRIMKMLNIKFHSKLWWKTQKN